MDNKNILVTGANGFIGHALCAALLKAGFIVKAVVNDKDDRIPEGCEVIKIGIMGAHTDWHQALNGIGAVVHLAGRAHILTETSADPLEEFRKVNVEATRQLAETAAQAGVKRFIFISSVGVNGRATKKMPFNEKDKPEPYDEYTLSKWEAEEAIREIARTSGIETVILRPPLVYGPDAPGNFSRLIRLVKSGLPLPLGGLMNLRSFIYIENLVDAIMCCVRHPLAAGQVFLVSDCQDISVADLIRKIAKAMNKPLFLLSSPLWMVRGSSIIAGKRKEIEKLTDPLLIDTNKIRGLLNWKPPFTLEQGISLTIEHHITA